MKTKQSKPPLSAKGLNEGDLTHPPKIQKLVKTGFDRDDVAPGHWWGDGPGLGKAKAKAKRGR
jgi:hypothetical protein